MSAQAAALSPQMHAPEVTMLPQLPVPRAIATTKYCTGSDLSFGPLELNQHARKLWGCGDLDTGVRAVFLTFGSHSMADFLLNWVAHVRRLDERLYLVGALDAKIAALCEEHGIPAATISDDKLSGMGVRTLGASSGYYRYQPGTFLRMGLIKQVFIRQMLLAGLDAMVSDVDVAWLRSPWPLVRYGDTSQPGIRPSARLLAYADVVLSVDQVQQYMDSDKHHWHVHSELNTGVAFFRNSPGALAVLEEWKDAMAKAISKGDPNHDQYWLNGVLRPRDFVNLKLDQTARTAWLPAAAANIIATSTAKHGNAPVNLSAGAGSFDIADAGLRALFLFKRRFGGELNASVTIGTFPIAEVSNGHTFFIQKLHDIVGVPPVCVHTTYQYGDGDYPYGKRERLRDAHLWLLDTPENHWSGRFLRLTSAPAQMLAPRKAVVLDPAAFDPGHCVRSHLKLSMLQRQWLMDAFILAKELDRIVVLPPLWCMLDRFWTIIDHCLIGSQVEMPQPFVCPLDHSYELPRLVGDLKWREHSFFSNPQAPPSLLANSLTLRIGAQAAGIPTTTKTLSLDGGVTFAEAVRAIKTSPDAQAATVISLDASDMNRMCRSGVGLSTGAVELAERLPSLLSHSYDFCETTDNEYFVACKKTGRAGCRKHATFIMNVTKGYQAPPPLQTKLPAPGAGRVCLPYQVPTKQTSRIEKRYCADGNARRACDIRVLGYE